MASVNIRELMQKPTDTFERPRELPKGHYYATIGQSSWGKSPVQKTDFLRFPLVLEGPGPDINAEDVAWVTDWTRAGRFGRDGCRRDFYITPAAMYMLGDFLDGVLGAASGRSADERYPDTRGVRVLIEITERPAADGPDIYNDVRTIVKAD